MQSPWQRLEDEYKPPRSKRFMTGFVVAVCLLTLLLFKFIAWVEGL